MKRAYRRHLPHQVPEGSALFLTWNLKGALPRQVIDMLTQERERLKKLPRRAGETVSERKCREGKIIFAMADRALDCGTEGPMHLKDPRAAKIVEDSILFGVPERFELYAWCLMSNHVHVLFKPIWDLKEVTQGIKGYSAHEINGIQNARGRVFWQYESYDYWVRDDAEFQRIIDYIENNPVAAGLCKKPEDWPWSSARFRPNWPRGEPFRRSGFPA